jgi:hypothetical protein
MDIHKTDGLYKGVAWLVAQINLASSESLRILDSVKHPWENAKPYRNEAQIASFPTNSRQKAWDGSGRLYLNCLPNVQSKYRKEVREEMGKDGKFNKRSFWQKLKNWQSLLVQSQKSVTEADWVPCQLCSSCRTINCLWISSACCYNWLTTLQESVVFQLSFSHVINSIVACYCNFFFRLQEHATMLSKKNYKNITIACSCNGTGTTAIPGCTWFFILSGARPRWTDGTRWHGYSSCLWLHTKASKRPCPVGASGICTPLARCFGCVLGCCIFDSITRLCHLSCAKG